ncbi:4837_t:CDS:1, partial [Racocetra fulgida]
FVRKYNREFKNLQHEYARNLDELEEFKRKCALKFEELFPNESSPEYRIKFKHFQRECDLGCENFKELQTKCNLNFDEIQKDCKHEFEELH